MIERDTNDFEPISGLTKKQLIQELATYLNGDAVVLERAVFRHFEEKKSPLVNFEKARFTVQILQDTVKITVTGRGSHLRDLNYVYTKIPYNALGAKQQMVQKFSLQFLREDRSITTTTVNISDGNNATGHRLSPSAGSKWR